MKRLTAAISILAVVHLLGASGLIAEASRRGWLGRDRIRDAFAVLSGQARIAEDIETCVATQPARTSAERIAADAEAEQVGRTQLAMLERRVEDGWRDLEQRQLALLREKEAFEAAKQRAVTEAEARAKAGGDSGLQKELDLIKNIRPRLAKDLLKERADADVVAILIALDDRTAKRIVDQCKNGEERQWIGRILGQLKDRNAAQAEALGAGTSPASGA